MADTDPRSPDEGGSDDVALGGAVTSGAARGSISATQVTTGAVPPIGPAAGDRSTIAVRWRRWRIALAVAVSALVTALLVFVRPPWVGGVVALAVALGTLLVGGYRFGWRWTGFADHIDTRGGRDELVRGKTLWDWMQLLLVPAVLIAAAFLLNSWQSSRVQEQEDRRAATDRAIAADAQAQVVLQEYLDVMADLMLDRELRTSVAGGEIRTVARTRTLVALRQLDSGRQGIVVDFLYDSGLVRGNEPIVLLAGAELAAADLSESNLREANLSRTYLGGADVAASDLTGADLTGAYLSEAHFVGTKLNDATLARARLVDADFRGAGLVGADLSSALLSGANFSDADLQDADLTDTFMACYQAGFACADFSHADLRGANLEGANLDASTFVDAVASRDTRWPEGFDPAAAGVMLE